MDIIVHEAESCQTCVELGHTRLKKEKISKSWRVTLRELLKTNISASVRPVLDRFKSVRAPETCGESAYLRKTTIWAQLRDFPVLQRDTRHVKK